MSKNIEEYPITKNIFELSENEKKELEELIYNYNYHLQF